LARDASDFIDMVVEEQDVETLKTLYLMLATPNPEMHQDDQELNAIGASIVEGNLKKRGIPLPEVLPLPKKSEDPPRQGSLF
jgi:hypothetical protein